MKRASEPMSFADAQAWSEDNARALLGYLCAGFPVWAAKLPGDAHIVWRAALQDLPFTDVMRAARTWLQSKHQPHDHPTIGGIRELCRPAVRQRRELDEQNRRRAEAAGRPTTPRSCVQQALGVVLAAMDTPAFGDMERGECRYPGCSESYERAAIASKVDDTLKLVPPASVRMCERHKRQAWGRSGRR